MASQVYPPEATAIGTVACVNDKGIKFEGAESWSNYSKFAVGLVAPSRGDVVSVTFDKQGFIRSIAGADGSPAAPRVAGGSDAPSPKDRTITRLAVLKAAAEFGSSRPSLKSGEVLKIAESWERWVLRSTDPTDDLAEAF